MVEVTGLEPTTSWSRTKRATKLRYTSILYWSSNRSFHDPLVPRRPHASFRQRFPCGKTFGCSAAPPLPKNLARTARCDFREPYAVRATKLRHTSILYWSSNRSFRDLLVPRHPPYQKNRDNRQQADLLKSALLFYHMQFALSNIVALLERNIFGKRKSITAV